MNAPRVGLIQNDDFLNEIRALDPKSREFRGSLLVPVISEYIVAVKLLDIKTQLGAASERDKKVLLNRKIDILDAALFSSTLQFMAMRFIPFDLSPETKIFWYSYTLAKMIWTSAALSLTGKQLEEASKHSLDVCASIMVPVVGDINLIAKINNFNRQLVETQGEQKISLLNRKISVLNIAFCIAVAQAALYPLVVPWSVPLILDCIWCAYICFKLLVTGNALCNASLQHKQITQVQPHH